MMDGGKNRKVCLITGANGFVGQALCKRMRSDGWDVRGTIRLPNNVSSLPPGINAVQIASVGGSSDWSNALVNVDTVVHLAARTHVLHEHNHNSLDAYRLVNVAGTERLAQSAAQAGVKRFIYLSSVKVNGEGRPEPYTEVDKHAPADPYGITKWEAEEMLRRVADSTALEVVVLRPPLIYGPGVKANFLRLLDLIYNRTPLPLARVNNRRSLIYLENLVDAIIICISHPKAAGQTYLVSDAEDISTPELIRLLADALGKRARLFPFPPPLLQLAASIFGKSQVIEKLIGTLIVNSSKIRRDLDWIPPYTIIQGLKKTADWFLKGNRI